MGGTLRGMRNMATGAALRLGRELAVFVPDRALRALGPGYVPIRPPVGEVLQQAATHASQLNVLGANLSQAQGNAPQLEQLSFTAQTSFKDARQSWRALRQTPVSQLLVNRAAVKQQVPQLQAAVDQAYTAAAQAYPPTHPAWREAAKAKLMSEVSTFHVYARMAAVNVLGLQNMVAGPAPAPR